MLVKVFRRLTEDTQTVEIKDIEEDDEKFFVDNNVDVSIEPLANGTTVLHGTIGSAIDGGPIEAIHVAKTWQGCKIAMRALRMRVQTMKNLPFESNRGDKDDKADSRG